MPMEYDEDFIKEEVRNDWLVTSTVKKVWWVQLDLLKEFDRVCKIYNLRWFPIFGTLLGAIRHNGFIPWDDDIDLVMPREDYDKFNEIAATELKYPYSFQSTLTEKKWFSTWVSVRNVETTGARMSCLHKDLNNGISIDIMPLDGCKSKRLAHKLDRFPVRFRSVICNTYVNDINKSGFVGFLRKILRLFRINHKKSYLKIEKKNRKRKWKDYDHVTYRALSDINFNKKIEKVIWNKEDFDSTIDIKFENITIPVPIGYDRILKKTYGNYMEFPPMDKRKGKHDMFFDPDKPYKEYL